MFFFFQNVFFLFLFFFSLVKFKSYWLTQSQKLFFLFFRHGKKKTAFLLTDLIFPKKGAKTNFAGEKKNTIPLTEPKEKLPIPTYYIFINDLALIQG